MKRSAMKDFIELCKMTQPELKEYVAEQLGQFGYEPESADGYVYARELGCPVLLTAHLDTVHKEPVRDVVVSETGAISSPQGIGGDDRCGVFIILSLLAKSDYRPAILFCEDEEIGGVGSKKFCKRNELVDELKRLKFFVELDRMGNDDAVFYSDDNAAFHEFIQKITGYRLACGSFSDISHLMPAAGVSGVNLSCGYYNAHTTTEYVIPMQMDVTEKAVEKLCAEAVKASCESYAYTERRPWWQQLYYDYADDLYLQVQYVRWSRTETGGWIQTEADASYTCESEADGLMQFFKEHPTACWNDILDYQLI